MRKVIVSLAAATAISSALCGCSSKMLQNVFNPFYDPPSDAAVSGELSDRAISGGADNASHARAAFEHMAEYQRAHVPQPVNPVVQPAVVRLMWIPDHLNRVGDLVPAHYYYVRVLAERWAVSDAFELEGQLKSGNAASNVSYAIDSSDIKGSN